MNFCVYATLLTTLASWVLGQSSDLIFPDVSRTAISGNYSGPLRPQVHYSPPKGWLNDPNGMFYLNGIWHLYYQYNPVGLVAGNQSWGHATSKDLYHWINQPIAIFPINDSSLIFTGSAVVDSENTSGFFPDQDNGVVAIFTIATQEPVKLQSQGLAISYDEGYSFELYGGNPVLDVGSAQFRDPKVSWYEDHWVMVIAFAQEFVIGIYTSMNLKDWEHASNFSHQGLLGLQWECPNLEKVPIDGTDESKYLMLISINPGAPLGGSVMQYYLGDFDGYRFTPVDQATRLTDFSKDSYAGQFFSNAPGGEVVSINWASNWQYAQKTPTGTSEGWRSAMSLPRKHSLRKAERIGYVDAQVPYDPSPILGKRLAHRTIQNGSFSLDFSNVYSNAVYLQLDVTGIPTEATIEKGTFNYTFYSPSSGEYLKSGYYFAPDNYFYVYRGGCEGFDNLLFGDSFATNVLPKRSFHFEAVIDRSLYETFINHGELSSTSSFFTNSPLTHMNFSSAELPSKDVSIEVTVHELKSAWRPFENEHGIAEGNNSRKASRADKI